MWDDGLKEDYHLPGDYSAWQTMTDVDRKTKKIVVRCLRPYMGYGLPREIEQVTSED